jgi:hypothetical protein
MSIVIPPYGNRWLIVRCKADPPRWVEHCEPHVPPVYQWMIEPPRWKKSQIRLYPTFEDARAAFSSGVPTLDEPQATK